MKTESLPGTVAKSPVAARSRIFVLPFAATLFGSALLMFFLQPMFGKMLLPRLGGTPQVWNTCMVFFQLVLFAGYLYAHYSGALFGQRRQAALHIGLACLALFALPIGISPALAAPDPARPVWWLMQTLVVSAGAPLFVISSTAPLVQKWFSSTRHPAASDPYFLYVASNLGSLLALVTYPLLVEPFIDLGQQARFLSAGFLVLVLALALCAALFRRHSDDIGEASASTARATATSRPGWRLRLRWLLLSFVPSSLLLGVTTHITSDIAAVPLFWILPLALYLLSFVIVFARQPVLPPSLAARGQALIVSLLVASMLLPAIASAWPMLLVHLLAFVLTALVCHGELVRTRPAAHHLTGFYLWLSAGGVLGGAFNALLAPAIFPWPLEYPLVLAVACLLRPPSGTPASGRGDLLLPLLFGGSLLLAQYGASLLGDGAAGTWFIVVSGGIVMGAGLVLLNFSERPRRYALGVTAVLLNAATLPLIHAAPGASNGGAIARSFFGIYKVYTDEKLDINVLRHGTTVHGAQSRVAALAGQPLLYYHRNGPFGDLFAALATSLQGGRIAVVGLGVGALGCYGTKDSAWTYYEIDPLIERLARDPRYFSYLRDCPPATRVVIGDARVTLREAPDHAYDLIVIDAFSSDAIPTHLLTREAIAGYVAKLAPHGVLALHISNRYLDLAPVIGAVAREAGLAGRVSQLPRPGNTVADTPSGAPGTPAQVAILARRTGDLHSLAQDARWRPLPSRAGERAWSDDYVNVLGAFRWRAAE